jgi:hypothetical protein
LREALRRWRPEDRWACLAAYGALLCWCLPLLVRPDLRGSPTTDWEWFLSYFQALRTTILDHGQFPGFNPWMYLGTPLWANPQIGPVSHFTPLVLLFGPIAGMKLGIVASYLLSFETGRALGRHLFKKPLAGVMAGLLYALNTALAAHWVIGQACFGAYALAPLLVLCCLRLPDEDRPWAGAAAGATAGLMIHYGVHYFTVYALLFCGILCLGVAVSNRAWRRLPRFVGQFALALVAVAAVRILPMLDLLGDFPRKLWLPFGFNAEALGHAFFLPELGPPVNALDIMGPKLIYHLSSSEFYAYPGMLVLALALVSLRWRVRFFHVGALLAFLLMLGTYQPWHLSRWLALIPPFDSMWVVSRWRVVLLACLALAAACALDHLLQWIEERAPRRVRLAQLLVWLIPLELLLLLLPSWVQNVAPYLDLKLDRATIGLPETEHMLSQRQVRVPGPREPVPIYFSLFRANVGVTAGYDPLFGYLPAPTARTFAGHRSYRGEYHLARRGQAVVPQIWSPNRLRFIGLPPGEELEINLNPGRGWTLNGEPLFEGYRHFELRRRFVITVPPSGAVDLRYTPPGLVPGLWLALLAGAVLGGVWWLERRRRAAARG